MQIIRADELGMCFGVRDALQIVDQIKQPADVTIHGELVHNAEVARRLDDAGFEQSPEADRDAIPATPLVLITAHGVSDAERGRLEAANKQLIDTTCPLVRLAHQAARQLRAEGRRVLVIGKSEHVEVRGLIGDLSDYEVIGDVDEVARYDAERLGVVCQTTTPPDVAATIRRQIVRLNPTADIRFVDTICQPTKLRQQAMRDLVEQVDAVVVIGGRNSNNTRQLVRISEQAGRPAVHVTGADELDAAWFEPFQTIGLSAGTSTLDRTIDEVYHALVEIGRRQTKGVIDACQTDSARDADRAAT